MASMHKVCAKSNVQVTLNLNRKELDIQFPHTINDEDLNFRFRLPISQLSHIYMIDGGSQSTMIIPFDNPPQFFVQKIPTIDSDSLFPAKECFWNDWVTWFRETDVMDDRTRREMQATPLLSHKQSGIIDIGMI